MSILVKINGITSFVVSQIDPKEVANEGGGGWWSNTIDWLNEVSENIIDAEVEFILKPFLSMIKGGVMSLVNALNTYSVEIITLGVIGCAIGMILAPLMGSKSGTWFGRAVFVSLVGAVWRLMI